MIRRPTPTFVSCTVVTEAPEPLAILSNSSTLPPTPKYKTFAATRINDGRTSGDFPNMVKDANNPCFGSGICSLALAECKTESRAGTLEER